MIWVCPVLHPAAVLRGRHADESPQITYLGRVRELVEGGWQPEDVSLPPSNSLPSPTPQQAIQFLGDLPPLLKGVAVDIETAHDVMVCIGFARLCDEHSLCVNFRGPGGAPAWDRDTTLQLVTAVGDVLANPDIPKVFQNGQAFDIPYLTRMGFVVNGYAFDTMLGQRHAYPELPANLEFIGGLYAKMPGWKWLSKGKEEGDAK